jgi:hypothetical protein
VPEQGAAQEVALDPTPEPAPEDLSAPALEGSFGRQAPILCITVYICYFTTLNVCRLVLCT